MWSVWCVGRVACVLVFRERKARGRGCREFRVSPLPHCLPAQLPARPPPHHRRVADYVVLNKIDMLGGGGGAGSDDAAATLGSLSAIVASLNPLAQVRWLWRWLCGDRLARLGAPARCQRAGRRRLLPPPSIRHHRFPPPPLWRARQATATTTTTIMTTGDRDASVQRAHAQWPGLG